MLKSHDMERLLVVILRKEINCGRLKFRAGVGWPLHQNRTVATCGVDVSTLA
jgi:hypothetical protein